MDSQPKLCDHTANPVQRGRSGVNPGSKSVAEVEPRQDGLGTDLAAAQLQRCSAVRPLAEKELPREGGTDPHFYLSPKWLLAVGLRRLSS